MREKNNYGHASDAEYQALVKLMGVTQSPRAQSSHFRIDQVTGLQKHDSILAAAASVAINVFPFLFLATLGSNSSGQPLTNAGQGMAVEFVEISRKTSDETSRQKKATTLFVANSQPTEIVEKVNQLVDEVREPSAAAEEGVAAITSLETLSSQYEEAIRARILASWSSTGGDAIPANCEVVITQALGGDVISVVLQNCADEDDLLEMAILRAQPLPYKGFEPAFSNRMQLVLSN